MRRIVSSGGKTGFSGFLATVLKKGLGLEPLEPSIQRGRLGGQPTKMADGARPLGEQAGKSSQRCGEGR